jgi:hypothetical protein
VTDYDAEGRWHWWLQFGDAEPREVTRAEWIAAERAAGFRRKGGGEGPATQSWGTGQMSGYRTLRDDF